MNKKAENQREVSNVTMIKYPQKAADWHEQFPKPCNTMSKPNCLGVLGNPDNQIKESILLFKLWPSKKATAFSFFEYQHL